MKRIWIAHMVFLGSLVLANPCSAEELKITLEVEGRSFLVGAPIVLHATIENSSGRELYLAYGEKGFRSYPIVEALGGNLTRGFCPLQDRKKVEWREGYEIKSLRSGACLEFTETLCEFTRDFASPGTYQIVWRAESLGPYERRVGDRILETYPYAWAGTVDSEAVTIEVVAPVGIDREALDKVIRPAVQDPRRLPGLGAWGEMVVDKYPTSTYAGYVLAKRVPDYSNPLFHPVAPEEQVRRSREQGQTVVTFPEKDFEAYFAQLERYLKGGNVPEELRTRLYGFYGDLLVQRGRFAEAAEAFRQAVACEPADATGKAYYQRSLAFLKALG